MIGSGRCGSTALAGIIASHSDVAYISWLAGRLGRPKRLVRWDDMAFRRLARIRQAVGPSAQGIGGTPPRLVGRLQSILGPWEGYPLFSGLVSPMMSAPFRDLEAADALPWISSRLQGLIAEYVRAKSKQVFLHKFTGWPRARFLHAVFPDAKFVHVVRDGRAVANSLMHVPWWRGYRGPPEWAFGPLPESYREEWERADKSFPFLAALEWKVLMDAFQDSEAAIPAEQWLNVRYEDFVEDPRREVQRVLAFAGMDWTATFERLFTNHSVKAERRFAYLHELGRLEIDRISKSLSSHLLKWGYPVTLGENAEDGS